MTLKRRSKILWGIWLRTWGTISWTGSSGRWEEERRWQCYHYKLMRVAYPAYFSQFINMRITDLIIPPQSQQTNSWTFKQTYPIHHFFLFQQPGVTAELYTNASLSIQRDMPELYARIRPEIRFAHEAFFIQDESEIRRLNAWWLLCAFSDLQLQLPTDGENIFCPHFCDLSA